MSKTLGLDDLIRWIHTDILNTDWRDEFAPNEGKPNWTGPDIHTELQGFKYDAQRDILEPFRRLQMEDPMRRSITTEEAGGILFNISCKQGSSSAGPFIRILADEFRQHYCPDFIVSEDIQVIEQPVVTGPPPVDVDVVLSRIERIVSEEPLCGNVLAEIRGRFNSVASILPEGDFLKVLYRTADDASNEGLTEYARAADQVTGIAKAILWRNEFPLP